MAPRGHAHALNLRDSGAKKTFVRLSLREGSAFESQSRRRSLKVMEIAEARSLGLDCDHVHHGPTKYCRPKPTKIRGHDNIARGAAIAFATA